MSTRFDENHEMHWTCPWHAEGDNSRETCAASDCFVCRLYLHAIAVKNFKLKKIFVAILSIPNIICVNFAKLERNIFLDNSKCFLKFHSVHLIKSEILKHLKNF